MRNVINQQGWCHEIVKDVSRTFALTVEALDEPMASYIALGYITCRIPDTVEDSPDIGPKKQAQLFYLFNEAMRERRTVREFVEAIPEEAFEPTDDWRLVKQAERALKGVRSLPLNIRRTLRDTAVKMTTGMDSMGQRHDGQLRVQTVDELEEYCYYVAGVVGEMITDLLLAGADDKQQEVLTNNDVEFGLLLQLTNIAKDVHADWYEERDCYLPEGWLQEHGIGQGDIFNNDHRSAVTTVIERLIDRAEAYRSDAEKWLQAMPLNRGNTTAAWAAPYLMAVATLRELRNDPAAVLDRTVKIERDEVYAIVEATEGMDRERLPELRESIEDETLAS